MVKFQVKLLCRGHKKWKWWLITWTHMYIQQMKILHALFMVHCASIHLFSPPLCLRFQNFVWFRQHKINRTMPAALDANYFMVQIGYSKSNGILSTISLKIILNNMAACNKTWTVRWTLSITSEMERIVFRPHPQTFKYSEKLNPREPNYNH